MNEVIKGAGFHHIAFRSVQFDKSVAFYKGLGFKAVMEWGADETRAIMLDIGDGGFFEIFANGVKECENQPQAGEFIHIAIKTTDPDGAFNKAIELGATAHREPFDFELATTPPTPVRLAFVKGPDGEVLEFFCNR